MNTAADYAVTVHVQRTHKRRTQTRHMRIDEAQKGKQVEQKFWGESKGGGGGRRVGEWGD
jgi:hypothetical protein